MIWGPVLKRDLLGETREEDKIRSRDQLIEYLKAEIKKQGKQVVIKGLFLTEDIDDLSGLFYKIADGVKSLDLSDWRTSNVVNMSGMFAYCENLEKLDLSGWETSNVVNMSGMFAHCENLKELDLSKVKIPVYVNNMSYMFYKCSSLESLELSLWNTTNVEDMFSMFYGCTNLKSLDLTSFDTSNVKDMSLMFANCEKLKSLTCPAGTLLTSRI